MTRTARIRDSLMECACSHSTGVSVRPLLALLLGAVAFGATSAQPQPAAPVAGPAHWRRSAKAGSQTG